MRYVLIGKSNAVLSAAKAIRGRDAGAEITILSVKKDQAELTPLVASMIGKKRGRIGRGDNPFTKYNIHVEDAQATGVHASTREVTLSSGKRMDYDELLIDVGRTSVLPDISGIKGTDIVLLGSLEDARNVTTAALGRNNAVVLGGGFTGLTAAIALKHQGLRVTVIEKLGRILCGKLDARGSAIVSGLLQDAGIDLITNQRYYEIAHFTGSVRAVRLASGRIVDADMIVAAVGARPNTEVFQDAGIEMKHGIVVREDLRTSVPHVYAAGNAVELRDADICMCSSSVSQADAEEMGRVAGLNMTGAGIRYRGFHAPANSVELLSTSITTIGMVDPTTSEYEVAQDEKDGSYRKLVFKNDTLVGALFIGSTEETGVYAYLIKNRIPLGKLKEPVARGQLKNFNFATSVSNVAM